MSFFKTLLATGLTRVIIDTIKTESEIIVIISPKRKSTDPNVQTLKPLRISYPTIEEMDEKFLSDITRPLTKTGEYFNQIDEYEKQIVAAAAKSKEDAANKSNAKKSTGKAATKKEDPVKEEPKKEEASPDLFSVADDISKADAEKIIVDAEKLVEEVKPKEEAKPELVADAPEVVEETVSDAEVIEETQNENMTLISGIPPWLIMYFEKLQEKTGKKITQLFPNLSLLITGGVNYEPYREKMEMLLGKKVDTIQTYPASEGFFAFQDDYRNEGLLLLTNHGIFYEFIPLEEYGKSDARRLTLSEVELGQDYALILTTNSGLWAYSIGDVVRFISKDPHRIVVSGRTSHFTSAFGEHVIAIEIEKALEATLQKYPCSITEFHLAPQVTPEIGLPYHEWLIEFEKKPENLEAFANHLDRELAGRNSYYKDLIDGNVLKRLQITLLEKGAFQKYAKAEGKLGGQNKTPRLANDRKTAEKLLVFQENSPT